MLLFSVASYAVLATAMLVHHLTRPIYPGFREWMLSAVGQAVGLLLVATYPEGTAALAPLVLLANLILLASADQLYRGMRRFAGQPSGVTLDELLVYLGALAGLCYWIFVDFSVPHRVAVNGVAMAYPCAKSAAAAWRASRGPARGTARFLAVALTSTVVLYLGRALAALAAGRADALSPVRQRSGPQTVLLLALVIHGTAVLVGLLMLVSRRAQNELQEALAQVRRLEGIIPICMHCFRVRTDKDTWDRLEKYVEEHTEAELSHGVCPDCLEKHYPQFAPAGTGDRGSTP